MSRPYLSFFFVALLSVVFITGRCQDNINAEKQLILNLNIFSSDTEKKYFKEIASTGSTNLFQLMLVAGNASHSTATVAEATGQIETFVQRKEVGKQYSSKELKKLYAEIHQTFFTQYIDNPVFAAIFANGNYNCATASALYAILLNKLNVEYSIREKPTHVYIVVAPSSHNLVYETTAPGVTLYQLNQEVKNKYLDYLHDNKLIGKEEWENSDRNALFEKYFYGDKAINLQQLCGLLYYNLGVEAAQKDDYVTAYKNFEKAYFLHPGSRMKYFVSMSLYTHIYKAANMREEEKLNAFKRYVQIGDSVAANELIGDFVEKISKKYLFQYPDMPRYLSMYSSIVNMVKDSALLRIIRHDHYNDMAHYYSIKDNIDSSKTYLDSLYNMNTGDLLVQELISQTVMKILYKLPEGKEGVAALKDYFRAYPFLTANSKLQDYQIYCLARETGMKYDLENEKEGRKYLEEMKAALDGKPELARRGEQYIELAIGEVCGFYVRKQDYKTARDILAFFKKLLPENEEINRRFTNAEKRMNQK
ncbi:hypothetical protein FAM09_04260 [Niastella caeni]|uniref:Uncharacterized protein n=1 Tax=Niastella caeni TaxID=2569763 RepID=A0A4S8I060_9BACT|nr:hypothetical protein [Niastella caeni]THU41330.1 hypothetical protein FAM09_04260 [Niastella caeni]